MVESGDVLDVAGSFQQDGDIIIGTGPTRSWREHEVRVRVGGGWAGAYLDG